MQDPVLTQAEIDLLLSLRSNSSLLDGGGKLHLTRLVKGGSTALWRRKVGPSGVFDTGIGTCSQDARILAATAATLLSKGLIEARPHPGGTFLVFEINDLGVHALETESRRLSMSTA